MNKIIAFLRKQRKITKRAFIVIITLFVVFSIITVWGNITLSVERISIETAKLNLSDGYKIAHISDYHNTQNKFLNDSLLTSLKDEKPDMIFVTGDLVDCRKTDINKGLEFISKIIEIAPVYYVTGNHECNISIFNQELFDNMVSAIEVMGVTVLRDQHTVIELPNNESFKLFGIDDPYFNCGSSSKIKSATETVCSSFEVNVNEFNILLAHHPEQIDIYSKYDFDLVYSGHAHGGQGRLFGIGLIAPDQGLFPKYTSGLYEENNTKLIVSRGIGNSIAPVRILDRPHLIYTIIE